MNPHYALVARRAGHRCGYCRAPEVFFNFPFEVEHIVPLVLGGTDSEVNLALACRSCNLWKSAHITGVDPEGEVVVALYNPRQNDWAEHFEVEGERGEFIGRTAIGRATVAQLKLNSNVQLAARQQWMRLGLFP